MRSLFLLSFFLVLGFVSYFATSAMAQTPMKDVSGNIVELCEPIPQSTIAVCPPGLAIPGCADRAPKNESEKLEHRFFSIHPELFPDQYWRNNF